MTKVQIPSKSKIASFSPSRTQPLDGLEIRRRSFWDSFWRSHVQTLDYQGVLLIVLSAIGFGTLGIFGKFTYAQGFDLWSTLFWRVGGGAIALWLWLIHQNRWRVRRQSAIAAFSLGAVGYALQSALFFSALAHGSAGITALMFYTYPAFVALLNWLVFRKSLGIWQPIALGLALIGCFCTVDWHHQAVQPLGILLGIASGAGYAIYMFCSARLVKDIPAINAAAYMLLGATTTVTWMAIAQHRLVSPTNLVEFGTISGLALLSTALPITLLFAGLQRLAIVPVAILSTLEPVLAVLMGIFLLGEPVWIGQIMGGALILTSALILQTKPVVG